jgi:pimeloyl-ACP methyl ester carboxylesterase
MHPQVFEPPPVEVCRSLADLSPRSVVPKTVRNPTQLWHEQGKVRWRTAELPAHTLGLWAGPIGCSPSCADLLWSRPKQARVEVLAGLGHLLMMEAPNDAARAELQFTTCLEP